MNAFRLGTSGRHSSDSPRRLLGAALVSLLGAALATQLVAAGPASAWTSTLNGGPADRLVGTTATLVASFSTDVGPTPYYHMIFDRSTGQLLKACSTGTTCSTTVTKSSPITRTYAAVRGQWSSTYPPPAIQEYTNQVTVTWRPLVLTTSRTSQQVGQSITLTAQSATDVGPTPYRITIFDATTPAHVYTCGTGTVCQVTRTFWAAGTFRYVAFVSEQGTSFPPPNVQATSNTVSVNWLT